MATLRTFEELDCWKKAAQLRRDIAELVSKVPADEKYRLIDQIIRASRSVTANIAEGFGRFHYQEYVQYCRQARGSLYELIDHLMVAEECGLISNDDFQKYEKQTGDCIALSLMDLSIISGKRKNRTVFQNRRLTISPRLTNNH